MFCQESMTSGGGKVFLILTAVAVRDGHLEKSDAHEMSQGAFEVAVAGCASQGVPEFRSGLSRMLAGS